MRDETGDELTAAANEGRVRGTSFKEIVCNVASANRSAEYLQPLSETVVSVGRPFSSGHVSGNPVAHAPLWEYKVIRP